MAPLPFREVSLAEPAGLCGLHEEAPVPPGAVGLVVPFRARCALTVLVDDVFRSGDGGWARRDHESDEVSNLARLGEGLMGGGSWRWIDVTRMITPVRSRPAELDRGGRPAEDWGICCSFSSRTTKPPAAGEEDPPTTCTIISTTRRFLSTASATMAHPQRSLDLRPQTSHRQLHGRASGPCSGLWRRLPAGASRQLRRAFRAAGDQGAKPLELGIVGHQRISSETIRSATIAKE